MKTRWKKQKRQKNNNKSWTKLSQKDPHTIICMFSNTNAQIFKAPHSKIRQLCASSGNHHMVDLSDRIYCNIHPPVYCNVHTHVYCNIHTPVYCIIRTPCILQYTPLCILQHTRPSLQHTHPCILQHTHPCILDPLANNNAINTPCRLQHTAPVYCNIHTIVYCNIHTPVYCNHKLHSFRYENARLR